MALQGGAGEAPLIGCQTSLLEPTFFFIVVWFFFHFQLYLVDNSSLLTCFLRIVDEKLTEAGKAQREKQNKTQKIKK